LNLAQAWHREGVRNLLAEFDRQPASSQLVRDRCTRAGTRKAIKNQVISVRGNANHPLQQTFRFWGVEDLILTEQRDDLLLSIIIVTDFFVRPPRPWD